MYFFDVLCTNELRDYIIKSQDVELACEKLFWIIKRHYILIEKVDTLIQMSQTKVPHKSCDIIVNTYQGGR